MNFRVQFKGRIGHLAVTIDEPFTCLSMAEKRAQVIAESFARTGYTFMGIYDDDDPQKRFVRRFNLEVKTIITPIDW